ncbi:MASE1 domain-containing protein [Streptomyces sp. HUAS ZL42]|uniref:MASE1 domain-containing protein n=1 Tax=Streptomyces sp. HUAS ZL42 TaxID=3231715 RepID=UPI00345EDA36
MLALVVCAAVLLPVATRISLRFLFPIYPLVIWAALRLQLAGSTVCALFASVMAITAATEGIGPFAHHTRVSALILLRAVNGCMSLTALLSAVSTERLSTRCRIEQVCQEPAEVVEQLAPGEPFHRWPLPERDEHPHGRAG